MYICINIYAAETACKVTFSPTPTPTPSLTHMRRGFGGFH